MKICIDAGHTEGYNPSPCDRRYCEGTRMFLLQGFLKRSLEHFGFEVVCTRKRVQENPSLAQRGSMAKGCDLLLSLHTNAVGNEANEAVDYVCAFYPISGKNADLAQALSELTASVMKTEQLPQTRIRKNSAGTADYYGVMRNAANVGTAAILLEHSFHTNPRITQWLLNDDNLRALADAQAALLAEYFSMEGPEMRYERVKDVQNPFYRPTVDKLLDLELLQGKGGSGEETILDLGEDAIRLLVVLDRAGVFDKE